MAGRGDLGDVYKSSVRNVKRDRFLGTLPAEFQNFFQDEGRFTIRNAGCLTRSSGEKIYDKIGFISQKPKKIAIYGYNGNAPLTNRARSLMHAHALVPLYDPEWETSANPSYVEQLGVIISILCTYTRYNSMKDSGLKTYLEECNLTPDVTEWRSLEEIEAQTIELANQVAVDMGLDGFDDAPQAFTVVALSVLVLIGKNVTEVSKEGWFRNRWRALSHVLSVDMDLDRIRPPLLKPCQAIYSASCSNNPIRAFLFNTMRSLSKIPTNQMHTIFDRIVNLMQWAEMSHMWMILEHVFEDNPDVLCFPELSGPEITPLLVAIKFLKRFKREDRAYLKLLYDHNDLTPLHSTNFIYFTAAAHAIAAQTKTSMLNINTRFSESVREFQQRVLAYLDSRNRIGPMMAASSFAVSQTTSVKEMLFRSIEIGSVKTDVVEFEDRQPEARE